MKNVHVGFVVGAVIVGTVSSQAETLAWYHFNEVGSGAVARGSATVLNTAADGVADLQSGVFGSRSTSLVTDHDECLPVYTNAFPSWATWRDPASGTVGGDCRGMYFGLNSDEGMGSASVLYTDDIDTLKVPSVTVEAFVKSGYTQPITSWKNLIALGGLDSGAAWVLRWDKDKKLRWDMKSEEGDIYCKTSDKIDLADGNWHHVAFTFDGTTQEVRVYIDYEQVGQKSCNASLYYVNDRKLEIGAFNANNYGRWQGWIDEVRISNEALPVERFLRCEQIPTAPNEGVCDSGTAFYQSFDNMYEIDDPFFGTVGAPFVGNETSAAYGYFALHVKADNGMWSSLNTDDVPMTHVFGTADRADLACWQFRTNAARCSSMIYIDDRTNGGMVHDFTSGDFTFETFIRWDKTPSDNTYVLCQHNSIGDGSLWLNMQAQDKLVLRMLKEGADEMSLVGVKNGLCDGKWHHIAVVGDRKERTVALYVDYEQCGDGLTDFTMDASVNTAKAGYTPYFQIGGGYGVNHNAQQDCLMDEVRMTRRALEPAEFLKAHSLESTRAWLSFDKNYSSGSPFAEWYDGTDDVLGCDFDEEQIPGIAFTNATDGVVKESNPASLRFAEGGRLLFAQNNLLKTGACEQTVEFFMKAPKGSAVAWTSLIHANEGSEKSETSVWSVRFVNADGGIGIRVDSDIGEAGRNQYLQNTAMQSADCDDGKWHHIGITFELSEETNTQVSVYKDYELLETKTLLGRLKEKDIATSSLSIGAATYRGWIDEVRISKAVLPVESFLRPVKKQKGFMILFR